MLYNTTETAKTISTENMKNLKVEYEGGDGKIRKIIYSRVSTELELFTVNHGSTLFLLRYNGSFYINNSVLDSYTKEVFEEFIDKIKSLNLVAK